MRGTYSTPALVWSRIAWDRKRHVVAASAVAILMASFLAFNAVASGLSAGIHDTIVADGHDHIQLTDRAFGPGGGTEADYTPIASWDGVVSFSPRAATATGIEVTSTGGSPGPGGPGGFNENATRQIVLVRIDADAEAELVTDGETTQTFGGRGFAADEYRLLSGRWIESSSEAVVTDNLVSEGLAVGRSFAFGGRSWTIVGVVSNFNPATVSPQGVLAGGHVIVDGSEGTVLGAYIQLEPDFATVQDVTQRIIDEYPQTAFGLQAGLEELEAQQYDAARTQTVLSAAARLVGIAGAATVFAMSLFLLIGERKAFGTMSSIGFSRPRLASYMLQKMVALAVLGTLAGGAVGWLVLKVMPAPEVTFAFSPVVDAAAWSLAGAETLVGAVAGSLLAFFLTIRQDPILALHSTE